MSYEQQAINNLDELSKKTKVDYTAAAMAANAMATLELVEQVRQLTLAVRALK